ncbi:hypothetical protein OPV22_007950 [Ensete ventricosum]|uniref:C2H2-type domain-containing protein n=1 Tax=Ensete ventricosum TaxID=4639 RepID=A0AAV8RFE9_ENSVE|nr:hypothetical protein OPV22_007950 [Ensete ventricosum]RWW20630.1 hypothetical protein GW17_00015249 [Ensete ventricosum]RWW87195.1 hypothetical protein BHE74_00003998 [Ensete ventricosum]RZR81708.1 hypothetical protein BHM03_00008000 [Ensete ventricosum]
MDAVVEDQNNHSVSSDNSHSNGRFATATVKGKRTKRQRAAAVSPASSTSSAELSSSATEEEEDMANCLILLAQGRSLVAGAESETAVENASQAEKSTARKLTETATTANGKPGVYVYQCKTCDKCFPSFQALGGHRTSHKKPKMAPVDDGDGLRITMNSPIAKPVVASHIISINKPRVHECSICGAEFSSGQALGGHMRRHRPTTESSEAKKEKNVLLPLDLNLPAPSDDDSQDLPKLPPPAAAFPFETQQPLVFSASALVDCHY